MTIPWQDFFRPDLSSSNRSLKKYLREEGLDLGHRDLVLVRKLSEQRVFLSYAVLEAWSEEDLTGEQIEELLSCRDQEAELQSFLTAHELASFRTEDGTLLVGISGELELSGASAESSGGALIPRESQDAGSPLLTVYGSGAVSQPGAGGMWDEDELQAESITLLDGESAQQLVEAFRHLFRAAPNGQARASVVAAALSRHREELDLEVAQKLEEIAPPFGQAMRKLFGADVEQGSRALQFLLHAEREKDGPSWGAFWRNIRPTILHSLTRSERGSLILIRSVDHLAAYTAGDELLNHQLLEAFLQRLNTLTPRQQDKLMGLVVEWAVADTEAIEILQSQLSLSVEKDRRLLVGESLRRAFVRREDTDELEQLARVFVEEAISAGSTAGSIALTELLRAFGPLVLKETAATRGLEQLTDRQLLNVVDIWEMMVAHQPEHLPRVTEIYLSALQGSIEHLSLLLKSELLRRPPIYQAFLDWLIQADQAMRKKLVQVGYSWSLTVENRELVAGALRQVEWDFTHTWESEWRKPQLSFQRLGWLAECAAPELVEFTQANARLRELLLKPPAQLYFWHLMKVCADSDGLSDELRELMLRSAYAAFLRTESTQEEEREALFKVGATAVRRHQRPEQFMLGWAEQFRTGPADQVWWLAGVCAELYDRASQSPEPQRNLISAVIARLLSSGEQSMGDLLARALAAEDDEEKEPIAFLPLEVSNLCYQAVHAMASHPACPPSLQATVRRRLALFLISWANELKRTTDAYAFRETPLFSIMEDLVSQPDSQIQALLNEMAGTFLELHRKVPEKFRLEIRHAAQQFFRHWAQHNPDSPEAENWLKTLADLGDQGRT